MIYKFSPLENDYSYHFFLRFIQSNNEDLMIMQNDHKCHKDEFCIPPNILDASKEDLYKIIWSLQNEIRVLREEIDFQNVFEMENVYFGAILHKENTWKDRVLYLHSNHLSDIKHNDFIVQKNYLIGLVDKVHTNFASVKILSNRTTRIPVTNLRNNAKYILSGLGNNSLMKINYIDKNDPPLYGDILILDILEPKTLVAIVTETINRAKILQTTDKVKYVRIIPTN